MKTLTGLLPLAAATVVLAAGPASAGPVTVHDDAHVLDSGRVTHAATALPDPVEVFTTVKYADNTTAFDREASTLATGTEIVVAINTRSKHLVIRTGPQSHVRGATIAALEFAHAFGTGDYTAATIAALKTLAGPVSSPTTSSRANTLTPTPAAARQRGLSVASIVLYIAVITVILAAAVAFLRRRHHRNSGPAPYATSVGCTCTCGDRDTIAPSGSVRPHTTTPTYRPGVGYPRPPVGGYSPAGPDIVATGTTSAPQHRRMSAGAAGGLGAAAGAIGGGLLGYELGKAEAENEASDRPHNRDLDSDTAEHDALQSDSGAGDTDFGDTDIDDVGNQVTETSDGSFGSDRVGEPEFGNNTTDPISATADVDFGSTDSSTTSGDENGFGSDSDTGF